MDKILELLRKQGIEPSGVVSMEDGKVVVYTKECLFEINIHSDVITVKWGAEYKHIAQIKL